MKTFANNIIPFSPTHPGEVLKDEIEFLNISKRKLSTQMGVSYFVLNGILNLKRPVNVEFALRVEATLGLEAEMLINMQTRYDILTTRADKIFMQKLNEIRRS
ncbi:putative plasmid maintenance system antidote protein, XRE family [Paludibacter propionicigenes WB4]|uniref:Putative plasmid maintenance system antidote protein, XRE family n=1 Tax=Paludibacter propionicigenes (strain DSM 17365 / JCM 13257 / WB4) TaxID=694427 RepID=E4T1I5_PALPW|nr:HigA family addiction module antitoxin [Paludibacter propionicigenes]ADQ78579.1 putative plasmid maintenance system antidote protein, XRE family [Paludibacter propionicigenes WB4]